MTDVYWSTIDHAALRRHTEGLLPSPLPPLRSLTILTPSTTVSHYPYPLHYGLSLSVPPSLRINYMMPQRPSHNSLRVCITIINVFTFSPKTVKRFQPNLTFRVPIGMKVCAHNTVKWRWWPQRDGWREENSS